MSHLQVHNLKFLQPSILLLVITYSENLKVFSKTMIFGSIEQIYFLLGNIHSLLSKVPISKIG